MALRFAGGLYRVVAGYSGSLVRLRRVSDSVESDFGMTPGGWIDEKAVTDWIGGSSAKVVTLYNQTGGSNATQATAGDQPDYNASSYPTGRPSVKFVRTTSTDGTFLAAADDGVMNFAGDMTWCFSYEPNAINVGIQCMITKAAGGAGAGEFAIQHTASLSDGKVYLDRPNVEAGVRATTGLTVGAHQVVSGDVTGTSVAHFLNGAANGTDTLANGTATTTPIKFGAGDFSGGTQQDPSRGYMRAVMLWDSYEPAARATAEAMMRNETPALPSSIFLRGAILRRYTNQSIPDNTATGMSWELCDYDSDGFWSRSAPTRITIPSIGSRMVAELFGGNRWASILAGYRYGYAVKNGAAWPGAAGLYTHGSGAAMNTMNHWRTPPILVEPGDYFEHFVLQDCGASMNVEANAQTFFGIQLRAIEP